MFVKFKIRVVCSYSLVLLLCFLLYTFLVHTLILWHVKRHNKLQSAPFSRVFVGLAIFLDCDDHRLVNTSLSRDWFQPYFLVVIGSSPRNYPIQWGTMEHSYVFSELYGCSHPYVLFVKELGNKPVTVHHFDPPTVVLLKHKHLSSFHNSLVNNSANSVWTSAFIYSRNYLKVTERSVLLISSSVLSSSHQTFLHSVSLHLERSHCCFFIIIDICHFEFGSWIISPRAFWLIPSLMWNALCEFCAITFSESGNSHTKSKSAGVPVDQYEHISCLWTTLFDPCFFGWV